MSETADVLGVVPPFKWRGKEYELGPCTFKVHALYETWLTKQALDGILRHEADYPANVFEMMLTGHRMDLASRRFSFAGQCCWESLRHPPGQQYVAWLLLKMKDKDVDQAMIAEVWQHNQKRQELADLVMRQVFGQYESDPPAAGGAAEQTFPQTLPG